MSSGANGESYYHQTQQQQYKRRAYSHLNHVCDLDIDQQPPFVRQTNIVCSIGESCDSVPVLREMLANGMNIARINLTLGSYSYHSANIRKIREIEKEGGYQPCVAIAVDIVAPTVRTGIINGDVNAEVELKEGQTVTLTMDQEYKDKSDASTIWLDGTYFPNVITSMKVGDRVFFDDGAITAIVRENMMDRTVRCLVEQGGRLGSSKRFQLPRNTLYKCAVMERYRQGLLFAVENEADMIFTSFTDSGEDVRRTRNVLGDIGRTIKIIAKVETKAAIKALDELIKEADGIIIGRGDLGLELPPEKIFIVQKNIIARSMIAQKPVFVITQLLESMRYKPRPTRAEVSDVANAVLDGADGLILTVETSRGMYPIESLKTMHQICREAESGLFHERVFLELKQCRSGHPIDATHTAAMAAVEAANKSKASAIIVVTTTGRSANLVSSYRPVCPVLTITRRAQVARQCHLYRGLHPVIFLGDKMDNWSEDMDVRINHAIDYARIRGFLKPGDRVVIVTGWVAGTGMTNTVRVFNVDPGELSSLHVVRSMTQTGVVDD